MSTVLEYMLLKYAIIILYSTASRCCQNIECCKSNTQIGAVLIELLYAAMWLTVVTEKCMNLEV